MKREVIAKETNEDDILICMGGPKPYDARDFIEDPVDKFTNPAEDGNGED